MGTEVLDDDLSLLRQVRGMQRDETSDSTVSLASLVSWVLGYCFLNAPERLVGRVVPENIEDEALFDGLAHRVQVERLVFL